MYNPRSTIKNFNTLQIAAQWAGWLGLVQSLAWIGLTITGIFAYTCYISVDNSLSYGSLIRTVFLDLYFKGNCRPSGYQNYNSTILQSVETVLDPMQVLIWDCVYLGVAVFWFISSVLLLTNLRKNDVKLTAGIVLNWVFFMLSVCCMDLALGIIFGIDYGRFQKQAYNYNFNSIDAGAIIPNAAQLIAGEVTAISMMIISFKGFVLWIINLGLTIYLTVLAVNILMDKDGTDTLFMPHKDSDDILTTRPPIRAYDEPTRALAYNNEGFIPDNRSIETVEVNQEAIVRAAHMSRDASLLEHRFRSIDAFQQYPQSRQSQIPKSPPPKQQETIIIAAEANFPVPDYSPPPMRPNQNGILRNTRY